MEDVTTFTGTALPILGASLITAMLFTWLLGRFTDNLGVLRGTFAVVLVGCCIPFGDLSAAQYIRVLTGDLAPVSLLLFGHLATHRLIDGARSGPLMPSGIALAIVLTGLILYPTALGLTRFDLYAFGYYPIVLAPLILAIFATCVWFRATLAATALAIGFTGYATGLLESDNLWDYLIDPVITLYAAGHLVATRAAHLKLRWPPGQSLVETGLMFLMASFLLFAIFLAHNNPDSFRFEFAVEDGFIEWCTALVLFWVMLVCIQRVYALRKVRPPLFLGATSLLALLCLFGAGEEISWGQRMLDLEAPAYFQERNAQGEIGFHNLTIEVDGDEVKLNRLIFGTGLALAMAIYLFVATPLYRLSAPVTGFFHRIAAPMPRNYQVIGYLAIVATVELLVDSSKRGEMTEFAGSIMFALNVVYPYNPRIFDRTATSW